VHILVDQSGYELQNMGDVAMLQSCVLRLSRQWPDAEIMVIARSPGDLAPHCPDAFAVERSDGRALAQLVPRRYRPVWQSVVPYFFGRLGHRPILRSKPGTVLQAVRTADVVVAAGGGYLTDTWRWHATGVLGVLALAQRLGKPTAMFGQGIGPVRQRMLRQQARAVLPELAVLGLREGLMGRELALSFGARPTAVQVTGDDALELIENSGAYDGRALGVNMRVTGYAGVNDSVAMAIGGVVAKAAAAFDVPILGLPVSRRGADADLMAIRGMFQRCDLATDVILEDLATPEDLAGAAARCRAIVTGSYHAAVFGLAQGVPTVCVTKSSYYDGKFNGLSALFPGICSVISLDSADFDERLRAAIRQAWRLPTSLRASARDTAVELRDAGRAAYAQFRVAVEKTL
jgi:polysaccharide pyruvyl transferase WcaK-like protein